MSRNLIIEFLTSSLAIDINRSLSTVIFIIDASFNDASSFELSSIDIWLSHHYDFPRANPVIKTRSIQYMSPRKLVLGQHTIDISCWYSNGWYIFKNSSSSFVVVVHDYIHYAIESSDILVANIFSGRDIVFL